jgi:DNA helicase-2/ATP-dependent DNA helicase PcrA
MAGVAVRRLAEFGRLLARARATLPEGTLTVLLRLVVEDSGYLESLRDGTEEGEERIANVRELYSAVERYGNVPAQDALGSFLEEVALVSDVDELKDEADAITLLTLHAAKGLEYDAVFMVGMEEGLCPHSRSMDDPDQMEEERRLCYVGMTRARRRLYLVYTFRRTIFGNADVRVPSPFLVDIPPGLLEGGGRRAMARPQAAGSATARGVSSRVPAAQPATPPARNRRELFDRRRDRVQQVRLAETERLEPQSARVRPSREPDVTEIPVRNRTPEAAPALRFTSGEKVIHPIFGAGVVIASKQVGDDQEITVAFADKGVKRLMSQYARLEKPG